MRALQILEVKTFMGKLLIQTVFDNFLLSELTMNTFNRFQITGKLNLDFYSTQELETLGARTYSKWSEVKPIVYSLVRGNKTPLSFHISLMLGREQIESVIRNAGVAMRVEEVSGLYFHIKYENNKLYIITGIGLTQFTLDKTLEHAWDEQVKTFLKKNELAFIEE